MKILIVDDDPSMVKTIMGFLQDSACELSSASDANEALKMLGLDSPDAKLNPVDLIITDYEMPGLSGSELATIIRKNEALERTQVIMITTHDNLDTMQEAYSEGVIDFIAKPVAKQELLDRVASSLEAIKNFDPKLEI